ncbi:hypothetical protein V0R50_23205 [Pseudomonas sp. 148P]|uniref:Lipoprotein n=1 Tax=Pseudomonas ulcerans TaxID=3115852 RepID=A0ABU7HX64_9PSED|nr:MULTISPECIES: hypothetical protein [unclassified Pseudomonas]MEE1924734.1 hypothetical protein [Pseudomonas sp. 147P]MEE1936143.1 hypothetical protein [Pseudomonas sp. 148P]
MDLRRLLSASCCTLFLGLCSGNALATGLSESLVSCEPSFFKNLYAQRAELAKTVKLARDDQHGVAWLPVQDRREFDSAFQHFTPAVDDQGLRLTSYYDRVMDLGKQGIYYFWGFEIDASREQVMARLPEANWQEAGEYFISRPRIKLDANSAWQDNLAAASGIAPAAGSAEKLLMLSVEDGKTRLLCSLQGSVDAHLLQQERPDVAQGAKR